MESPRIKDEIWGNYLNQCKSEGSATQLRKNPQLQDLVIKSLQMTVQDLQNYTKKKQLENALKVLSGILINGKGDSQADICKSSSLPTLSLNLLRNFCRTDNLETLQELASDLILCITELSKLFFTKMQGIDLLFTRNIVPVFTQLLRIPEIKKIHMAVLKSLGSFICQAALNPLRSVTFLRDINENNILSMMVNSIQK